MASTANNPMNRKIKLPLAACLLILGLIHAFAADFKIVANPSIRTDSITVAELRGIFL
jgi:hypothetical protein